jgi:DNA invertase Pin-like site-specific DNA recombinase
MKDVNLYIRVSTDEQADKGFSLRDQEQKLLNYCSVNNLNVISIFREDHSAKTFNRPEFKKLLTFIKSNKSKAQQLLFTKWDRFSRNTTESYNKIKDLNELGVIVNAIEQPLDLSIPEQGLMLAVYLSMPEVENHRRSLNIIAGMRRALKEGRYIVSPPKGYTMGRDDQNKPVLVPNEDAKFITEGFKLLSSGLYSQKEVLTKLQAKGFKTSKAAFGRIVRNPLYKGAIYIKAFKNEPEQIVKGIHEPLVSEVIFDKVQDLINNNSKQYRLTHKKVNTKFPLKGFVLCPNCLKPLKASTSKGRTQYYSYYHCYKPCNTRYKAEDVELWFNSFLSGISLNKNAQKLLTKMIENRFNQQTKTSKLSPKHYQELDSLEQKLIKLQDLYLDGEFSSEEYQNAKKRYQKRLEELNQIKASFNKSNEILDIYKRGIEKLESFDKQFIDSNIDHKRQLLGSIFPEKFQFENNNVRTEDINPLLLKISSINKGLKENKKGDKSKKNDLSHLVLKVGTQTLTTHNLNKAPKNKKNLYKFNFYKA